ncbi:hypothetical protein [Actinospongicola halichondriae]|uniref:hypothetical protein n=1 Tax=Actinospongicola halichondriae TaxID=3236844 RepID=UPI003D5A484A
MPLTDRRTEIHRSDAASGRWFSAVGDVDVVGTGRVRIEVGSTGNRLDPTRRVRRRGHDLVRADGRLELRSWWPVHEVRTHATGQFVGDLRGEITAAGSEDVDDDLAALVDIVRQVFGTTSDDLVETVLVSAYPLLQHPLSAGARPDLVPVPVEPLLHHDDPRSAAHHALGPRVTRPLVRALAASLLPDDDGRVAWEPILLALMAADRCGPEQLVSILTTRPHRPGAVSFSLTDIDRARAMFEEVTPRRIADDLVAALETEGGTTELARRLIRHDARPPAPPPAAPAPRRPPARAAAPPRVVDDGERTIDYPAPWRAVDGQAVDGTGCRVALPSTGNELLEWGAVMGNCLGAYRTTAALGRTRIIGFADDRGLQYVAEVSPARTLRQLEAPGNTLPLPSRERAIVRFLFEQRLVEADARRVF